MSTSSLLEVMTREVEHDCARIQDSVRDEEVRLLATAREEAARRRNEAVLAAETELAEAAQRSRERAEAEAEMVVLTTKDTITDEILATVAGKLARIAETPEFPAVLQAMLEELLHDTEDVQVVLSPPEHVEYCRRWLADHGRGQLEIRGLDTLRDGVAVEDAQRSFRITNTFSARLSKQEGRLRKLCLERLLLGGSRPSDSDSGAS